MDQFTIGAISAAVATVAATATIINSKNSGRSANAAVSTHKNKYTPNIKHKISVDGFSQQHHAHLIKVDFTNIGELPTHIKATIEGRVQRHQSKEMYYDVSQDRECLIKSGEQQSITFELFTQKNWRGRADLILRYAPSTNGAEQEYLNFKIDPFNF